MNPPFPHMPTPRPSRDRSAIARGHRGPWTTLALLAVLSVSGHLLLEWGTEEGAQQAEESLRSAFDTQDCPLCRLLALGAAEHTCAVVPIAILTAVSLIPHEAVGRSDAIPLTCRPRAPPV